MGERTVIPPEIASTSTAVTTVDPRTDESSTEGVAVLTLRPSAHSQGRRNSKKVEWTEDTVDNENMNKKKSKCCCIYEKPRRFGEDSDSDSSDDECEHCFGHVEKKKANRLKRLAEQGAGTVTLQESSDSVEPTTSITLQPPPDPTIQPDSRDVPDST